MKKLLFLNLIIAVLSSSAQAATTTAIADQFLGSSGSFKSSAGDITEEQLSTIVTSDISTYAYTTDAEAYFDLGFGSDTTVTTGSGVDLVIFTAGNGYHFGLEVFDADNNSISDLRYVVDIFPGVPYDPTLRDDEGNALCINDADPCPAVLSGTNINLEGIADGTEIGFLRIKLGSDPFYATPNLPNFTLARAEYATVVPLPLPAVLFSSGLLLLGWIGRRKKHG